MTEVSLSKFMWEREREGRTMESCYKLYTWINHTVLMLLLQIFWKVSQISDYFKENWVQQSLVQATYWHDPLDEVVYKKRSQFLSDINNEKKINKIYIENLNRLENFVLVKFESDSIVQPRGTEWFGFYAPGQAKRMLTLEESDLYLKDRLGLKRMKESGKLIFLSTPGDHLHFTEDWFIEKILKPFLI